MNFSLPLELEYVGISFDAVLEYKEDKVFNWDWLMLSWVLLTLSSVLVQTRSVRLQRNILLSFLTSGQQHSSPSDSPWKLAMWFLSLKILLTAMEFISPSWNWNWWKDQKWFWWKIQNSHSERKQWHWCRWQSPQVNRRCRWQSQRLLMWMSMAKYPSQKEMLMAKSKVYIDVDVPSLESYLVVKLKVVLMLM